MTDDQKKRAFKSLLVTTKAKGSGLGLAIVGRIIETHQGQIRIRSKQGRGTTIGIFLSVI
jgi:signal transduction histidine kinase